MKVSHGPLLGSRRTRRWVRRYRQKGSLLVLSHRLYSVVRAVQGRSGQVIHGGVHDHEVLFIALFRIEALSDHDAGISHQISSRLKEKVQAHVFSFSNDRFTVFLRQWRGFVAVGNAETASKVEVLEGYAGFFQPSMRRFSFLWCR